MDYLLQSNETMQTVLTITEIGKLIYGFLKKAKYLREKDTLPQIIISVCEKALCRTCYDLGWECDEELINTNLNKALGDITIFLHPDSIRAVFSDATGILVNEDNEKIWVNNFLFECACSPKLKNYIDIQFAFSNTERMNELYDITKEIHDYFIPDNNIDAGNYSVDGLGRHYLKEINAVSISISLHKHISHDYADSFLFNYFFEGGYIARYEVDDDIAIVYTLDCMFENGQLLKMIEHLGKLTNMTIMDDASEKAYVPYLDDPT